MSPRMRLNNTHSNLDNPLLISFETKSNFNFKFKSRHKKNLYKINRLNPNLNQCDGVGRVRFCYSMISG